MKTKFLILIACMSLMLVGCENNVSNDTEPEAQIRVFRFKNPDYRNHLIVYDGKEHFVFINGNRCDKAFYKPEEVEFTERFRNPYWELPNGWYLTDWAWGGNYILHVYPDDYYGNVILEDVTVDNYKSYLYNGEYLFSKDLAHKKLPSDEIFEQRSILVKDLLQYLYPNGNYPLIDYHTWNNKNNIDTIITLNQLDYHTAIFGKPAVASGVTCLCEKAEEMDKYWELLQSQLTEAINNGDWDATWKIK